MATDARHNMNAGQLFNILQPLFQVQDLVSQSIEAKEISDENSTFAASSFSDPLSFLVDKHAKMARLPLKYAGDLNAHLLEGLPKWFGEGFQVVIGSLQTLPAVLNMQQLATLSQRTT